MADAASVAMPHGVDMVALGQAHGAEADPDNDHGVPVKLLLKIY
jgi:hypothetical protein